MLLPDAAGTAWTTRWAWPQPTQQAPLSFGVAGRDLM